MINVLAQTGMRTCFRLYGEPIAQLIEDESWWRIGVVAVSKKQALFRAGWWPVIPLRNAVFAAVVLATGLRRLFPPY